MNLLPVKYQLTIYVFDVINHRVFENCIKRQHNHALLYALFLDGQKSESAYVHYFDSWKVVYRIFIMKHTVFASETLQTIVKDFTDDTSMYICQ